MDHGIFHNSRDTDNINFKWEPTDVIAVAIAGYIT